jgi:phospholipid/cholesterol/gamma-HCH transport system substrate-binding protein
MRKDSPKLIRLGTLVAGGVALFILAIFFISAKQYLFKETFQLNVLFNDAGGVRKGDFVRYAGVRIGMVSDVKFENDTTVRVELNIEEEMHPYIKEDAIASIVSDGLVGNKIINIKPGKTDHASARMVADNATLYGKNRIDTDEVLDQLNAMNNDASRILENLNHISEAMIEGSGLLPTLFSDTTLGEDLQAIISSTRESSAKLNENMEALQHNWLLKGYFKKKKNGKLKKEEEKDRRNEE